MSEIVDVDNNHLNIHYDGWTPRWDVVSTNNLTLIIKVVQERFRLNSSFQKIFEALHRLTDNSITDNGFQYGHSLSSKICLEVNSIDKRKSKELKD